MLKLFVIEDDTLLNEGLCLSLSTEYECTSVYNCEDAKLRIIKEDFDLIVLDVNLPDGNGIDLCGWIKERKPEQKIIFLSANDTETSIIHGLQNGGEDYITKPFSSAILKEKIKVILKRVSNEESNQLYVHGYLKVDLDKQVVLMDAKPINLTATEFKLLSLLINNHSQVLTRAAILEKLWDANGNFVDENALSVNIRRLRQKIEENPSKPKLIKTVFGIGYTWGA